MNVGVRELKQHLSEYLRRVGEGETIQVTDRGKPIAVLSPTPAADPLAKGIEEGWIRPPLSNGPIGETPGAKVHRRVLDLLNEDRGE